MFDCMYRYGLSAVQREFIPTALRLVFLGLYWMRVGVSTSGTYPLSMRYRVPLQSPRGVASNRLDGPAAGANEERPRNDRRHPRGTPATWFVSARRGEDGCS